MRAALVQHPRARPTPRVAFGSLHETLIIASVANGLLLTFLGKPVLRAAAIVGGVGFGCFIDELDESERRRALTLLDAVPAPRGVAPPLRPVSAGP